MLRFGELESDAIDPQPYKLDRLRKSTKQLMEQRRETDPTLKVDLQGLLRNLPARLTDSERLRFCQDIDIVKLLHSAMAIPDAEIKSQRCSHRNRNGKPLSGTLPRGRSH